MAVKRKASRHESKDSKISLIAEIRLTPISSGKDLPILHNLQLNKMIMKRFVRHFKVDISLVAKLRKETECTITKARQALETTKNAYIPAVEWLHKDSAVSGKLKAQKLEQRSTLEGLIGVHVDSESKRFAMIELQSETDFVAKSAPFTQLAVRIARIAAEHNDSAVKSGSILPIDTAALQKGSGAHNGVSIQDDINATIGKLGEKINLCRAVAVSANRGSFKHVGCHAHAAGQSLPPNLGRIGAIVTLATPQALDSASESLVSNLAAKLAKHVCGFNPPSVAELLEQPFIYGGGSVRDNLSRTSKELNIQVDMADFIRWEIGSSN